MKLAVSVITVVFLGLVAAQSLDKTNCILGIQLEESSIASRRLQMAPSSSGVNIAQSISDLLVLFDRLTPEARTKITACQLNLNGAKSRCEAKHGANNCEITGMYAQKKCPAGTKKYGSQLCASECPKDFEDKETHCYKPLAHKSSQFSTQQECSTVTKTTCEQWVRDFWVPVCSPNYTRVGADQCVPFCPQGWLDSGRFCFKPETVILDAPYTWIAADN